MDRELQLVYTDLLLLEEQGRVGGLFEDTEDSRELRGLVNYIRDALVGYQVCIRNRIISNTFDTRIRSQRGKASREGIVGSL